jgi:hypothetical protein
MRTTFDFSCLGKGIDPTFAPACEGRSASYCEDRAGVEARSLDIVAHIGC